MIKRFKETRKKAEIMVIGARKKIKDCLDNERGNILPGVLLLAIIVLAVIAMSPVVREMFSDAADSVKAWVESKLTEVLK